MSVCDWILNIKNEIIKIKKERSILWKLNIYQLRILNQSKLVKYRKEGKVVYYSLDDEHISQIVKKGREHIEEL